MSFLRHKGTKNIQTKNGHPFRTAAVMDILRGCITIPGRLLSSIARFRFMMNLTNLNLRMYIYKLS